MRDIAARARGPVAGVAVVADDLTGAADAAAGCAAAGLATTVIWSADEIGRFLHQVDVLAIDVGTRARDATRAAADAGAVATKLRDAGVARLYKKSDSLLRGHIGFEAAAVLDGWHPGAIGIVTFAYPDAGRTTVRGRQYARELADGIPIAPLFERAGLTSTGFDLDVVRSERLSNRIAEARGNGIRIMSCDAECNADLIEIVRAGLRFDGFVVWVGSGGLARALASAIADGQRSPRLAASVASRRGSIMMVCGSVSAIARAQIARAVAHGVIPIEVQEPVLRSTGRQEDARAVIRHHIDCGHDLVIFPGMPDAAIDPAVARALGDLLSPLGTRIGGLAVTGGETASAVLRAWGITGLRIVGELAPGAPIAIAVGSLAIPVVTKPGAFGGADFFVEARAALHTMMQEVTGTS